MKKKSTECAFVLINTETGSEGEVLQSLRVIEGVKEAYSIYGVYDVIAKIEASSIDELKNIVTSKIRRLNMVRTALIMIVTQEALQVSNKRTDQAGHILQGN